MKVVSILEECVFMARNADRRQFLGTSAVIGAGSFVASGLQA
ncbi:MAG: twin-arginine translocation signal domain-containing protein, partial [Planctomycetota bacterium]